MNKFAAALLIAALGGCSTSTVTPNRDAKFGNAVREAKLKMTINPQAGRVQEQVAGMDGKAAKESIVLYQDTFKAPPPVVNVINIGGGVGGGAK